MKFIMNVLFYTGFHIVDLLSFCNGLRSGGGCCEVPFAVCSCGPFAGPLALATDFRVDRGVDGGVRF